MTTPNFSPLALRILNDRYLWRDDEGKIIETPEQMLRRVAKCVAEAIIKADIEHNGGATSDRQPDIDFMEQQFYEVMAKLDFLPNSPTLMNAGRPEPHGQLAACFVVDVPDSMDGICEALRQQMLIHKTGGGTGFNFSKLRPKGSIVNSTNGKASGPVSFMRLFDLSTDVVQQGGMRRGANMAILDAYHPDIYEFIHCKDKDGVIANFNLSVGISDKFMENAVSGGDNYEARLLREIAESAWRTGDPGVVFLDALNRDNPTPQLGTITATNPCGESPLLPGESCNLGSINLSHMLTDDNEIDYDKLNVTVRTAVRFLNGVILAGQYPLPSIKEAVMRTCKIGLGVMGFADMLYKMRIRYGSVESLSIAEEIMSYIQNKADNESWWLGEALGIPKACAHLNRRNATLTCIAPTGTLALLADCSSGIEPVFSLRHTRKVTTLTDGTKEETIFNPIYEAALLDKSLSDNKLEDVFITAYDIPWWEQLATQATFQRYTDLATSKTVNLKANATVEDVRGCYVYAWLSGCKGTTVYRDGSKFSQVLTAGESALPEIKCTTC